MSVGEAMAIGRSFQESLQKALCSLETGLTGLDEIEFDGRRSPCAPNCQNRPLIRLRIVAQAFRQNMSVEDVNKVTSIDLWFLRQIAQIVATEADIKRDGLPETTKAFTDIKAMGFSDARLAKLTDRTEKDARAARHALNVRPVYKRIDTCAAEFAAKTPYLYSTYEHPAYGQDTPDCESLTNNRQKSHHPRRRPEPYRAGHRVRLLLLPRRIRDGRHRHRVDHGQL